ncbi:hypothetical protein [Paenibacillus sp. FSL L8-0708]|uniref:hypothetical protein n=1 Tax=Paenibacillus sp. FSL L8-0708 TaxID=2975311 RepID=UPI0030FAF420
MKKYKRRKLKKWFKRVAAGINSGQPIPRFYALRVIDSLHHFVDCEYLNHFRPWWYEELDKGTKLDFVESHSQHFKETERKFKEWSGIDPNDISLLVKEHKSRKARKRKAPKAKPEQPIRKLRNPEEFHIFLKTGEERPVTGERIFNYGGYDFFIWHDGIFWSVSDVSVGLRVYAHTRYKKAVEVAIERVTVGFDSFVRQVKTINGEIDV